MSSSMSNFSNAFYDNSTMPPNVPPTELFREWFDYLYFDIWEVYAQPQAAFLPLMRGGPWTVLLLVTAYLVTTLFVGPLFMRNRKAFPIKPLIFLFDIFLVLYNLVLVLIGIRISNFGTVVWFSCHKAFDPAYGQLPYYVGYAYFMSKFLDLVDTLFFVLRKKRRNLSFLHVYHHSVMPFVAWAGLKYVPYPLSGWAMGANCFIHVLMYSYYALAAYGYKLNIYWKQALTVLQMGHFITISLHGLHIVLFVAGPTCVFPELMATLEVLLGASFFVLFAHFFVVRYILPKLRMRDMQRFSEL